MTIPDSYIGIDIGTSSIKIAFFNENQQIVENFTFSDGEFSYPSYYGVMRANGKQPKFGKNAKNQMANDKYVIAYEVKRFIGKDFDDETIKEEKERVTYAIKKGENNEIIIEMGPQEKLTPIDFYEKILTEIKKELETKNIQSMNAVVTVPVTFGTKEREIVKKMLQNPQMGFKEVVIMNEPTGAAIDFGFKEDSSRDGYFAVFDYGGGTLDVSIINLVRDENGFCDFKVVTHGGLRGNGGSDLDNLIFNRILEDIEEGVIDADDPEDLIKYLKGKKGSSKLKVICEECKKSLSTQNDFTIVLPAPNDEESQADDVIITKDDFENICAEKFDEAVQCLVDTIKQSNVPVKTIIMVGGSSVIPCLKQKIEEATGIIPLLSEHPLRAVSRGAALQGAALSSLAKIKKTEKSTYSVQIEITNSMGMQDVYTIIPKDTVLPCNEKYTFRIVQDGQTKIVTNVFQDAVYPNPNKRLGEIEIYIDYNCRENDKVDLFVKHNDQGILELTFSLPDSNIRTSTTVEIDFKKKKK